MRIVGQDWQGCTKGSLYVQLGVGSSAARCDEETFVPCARQARMYVAKGSTGALVRAVPL